MYNMFPSWDEDVIELGANMTKECEDEVWASHGLYPTQAVIHCRSRSLECFTATYNGSVIGLTGLVPGMMLGQWASPWLLTTPECRDHPIYLVRHSKKLVARWLPTFPILENFVDARYTASLKWAKAVGFTINEAQPYGYLGLPFHRISIRSV